MGDDYYLDREQTKAKHFILKNYLQELAFKVLTFSDIAYVDGFSGPWQTKAQDFADSSFMIAIGVLRDAQATLARRGIRRRIRCFLCEENPRAFEKLESAVASFHKPDEGFEVKTFEGEFTEAASEIAAFVRGSFALIFIDPTGWTGYDLPIIKPLLTPRPVEVLVNYMHEFINRAVSMKDAKTVASFDGILGGPGWNDRLDPTPGRGVAVEKLFREELKRVGGFSFVVSTKIYRPTVDRPLFFLTYGTKNRDGLKAFRETEYRSMKQQAVDRSGAKERQRAKQSNDRRTCFRVWRQQISDLAWTTSSLFRSGWALTRYYRC